MEYTNKFLLGKYKDVKGSASRPVATDDRTIALFCTYDGEFESIAGNAAVAKVYPRAREIYRGWWRSQKNFKSGEFQAEYVSSDTEVAYLLTCLKPEGDTVAAFELEAIKTTLDKLGKHCSLNKRNLHINKVGTDEEWEVIRPLLDEYVVKRGVSLFVYSEQ